VVSLTVTDDDLDSGSDSKSINVTNVAPSVAAVSGPSSGVRLFTQTSRPASPIRDRPILGRSSGILATGNTQTGSGSPGAVSASHVYTTNGTYTVTLTVTDDDSGSDSKTRNITITSTAVIGGVLQIGGDGGNDQIDIKPSGAG